MAKIKHLTAKTFEVDGGKFVVDLKYSAGWRKAVRSLWVMFDQNGNFASACEYHKGSLPSGVIFNLVRKWRRGDDRVS